MNHNTEQTLETLRTARLANKMSQRALSAKSGLPQSHISHIENGVVDPKLSTLIELARSLGLELILVPRKRLPAVRAIVRNTGSVARDTDDVRVIRDGLRPAYSLDEDDA